MASYEELRSYARIIRNETKSSANTALRIGEMYLNIIDKMEDVDDRFKYFLTGTDTDNIINRWKELESFLNGYTETATLADLLSVKADKATTLAGYGITNAYTKVEVDGKITSVNTGLTTLQTTVSGHTTSINSLQSTVSGHTSSITSINSKITTLQGYFENGVAKSALRLSDGAEYKAWGQVFFKDGKPVDVSGAATFTQVKADSVLLGGKAKLSYDSNLNALLLTRDDGTAVHFLASGAVATRGLGEIEEGGGGTGTGVDLLNVPSDIIPIVGSTYNLGSSAKAWKTIYASSGAIGSLGLYESGVISNGYIKSINNSWLINLDGSASFSSLTINGASAATQNWVNSQSFAKISDLSAYVNAEGGTINNAKLTGDVTGNGWSIEGGIANFGEVNTDSLYVNGEGVLTSSSLANYVTLNSAQTISGKKTFTGGITASHLYSVEYLDSSELIINAEKVNFTYYGDDADVQIGLINGYKPLTLGNTSFSPALTSGTVIGTITIGGESKTIFAPNGGSADLSNYVTLDGEQTITGGKYFSDLNANSIYLQGFELKPYSPDGGTPDRLKYDGYVLLDEFNYKDYLVGNLDILAKGLQESSPLYDLSYLDYIRNYVSGKNLSVVIYNQESVSESIQAASTVLNVGNSANRAFRIISYKWGDLYWQKGNGNGDGWDSMRTILDSSNYATTLDSAYVKKSGDTVTGRLGFTGSAYPQIYGNGAYLIIGASYDGSYALTFDYGSHAIRPRANNDTALGISYVRWSNVYSVLGNFSGQITSSVADGTAPFVVASKSLVKNLNSEYVNGYTVNRAGFVTNTDGTTTMIPTLDKQCNVFFSVNGLSSHWTKFATITALGNNSTVIVTLLVGNEHQGNMYQGRGVLECKIRNDSSTPTIYFSAVSGDIDCSCFRCYYPTTISSGTEIELWVNVKRSWNSAVIRVLNETSAYAPINVVKMFTGARSSVETPTLEDYVEPERVSLATKLSTPRTIWGQSFDGSGNVSGNLTGVGDITGAGAVTIKSVNNTIALKYNGNNATSVILNNTSFKPYDVANGLLDLGSSSARWKGIYGQSLDLSSDANIGQHVYATGALLSGGKRTSTDGLAGAILGSTGYLTLTSASTPYVDFYFGNTTTNPTRIKETAKGTLTFSAETNIGSTLSTNPLKIQFDLSDATAKFYSLVNSDNKTVGSEMVALQTCFDGRDPETHGYVTQYATRCNLVLQPRGGQVYVGYTPTDVQSTYSLNVHRKMKLYGNSSDNPEVLFYRDGESSWKVINSGGNLIFQNNYTTAVQSSYFDVLKLNYNTGNAVLKGSLTTGGNVIAGGKLDLYDELVINSHDYIHSINGNADGELVIWPSEYLVIENDTITDYAITCSELVQTSDIRYKNILSNVHLKLSDIAAAPTFKFSWTNETDGEHVMPDGSTHIGTSAQYWQEIAGELVVANKKTGKLGLDYSTAALVSAVSIAREVNTMKMWQTSTTDRIEELEDKVKKLEEENKALRELLNNNN